MRTSVVRLCGLLAVLACSPEGDTADNTARLVVYNAAAIARPIRVVLDSFATRTRTRYEQETAASLELARKVIDLGGEPDVIVLADPEIFPKLLEPNHVRWHVVFARNRIVLAYTPRSKGASEINATNWFRILSWRGVEVGRSDPHTDPSGYRTLLVWQLAERYYGEPRLAARMLKASPPRNVRPREADQVALLTAGEYDYAWTYENLAKSAGFSYVKLPDAIDLGNPADSANYGLASVRVQGKTPNDSIIFTGRPILFAVSILNSARSETLAERFVAFLLSADGQRILRSQSFDALSSPVLAGQGIPVTVRASVTSQ